MEVLKTYLKKSLTGNNFKIHTYYHRFPWKKIQTDRNMMRFIVHLVLWISAKLYNLLLTPIILYQKCKIPKLCPAIQNKLLLIPAVDLAELIRNRKISSKSLIEAYINRAREVNEIVNAIVENRFSKAIEEAKKVDFYLKTCTLTSLEIKKRYPLLGVPFTVKESIAVKGMSHNAGITGKCRKNACQDASVVENIREAGAIPILVSNTPEQCLNWETVNKYTGRTLNPYDTRRTCGGSSGGEAALLGSAASVIGVGSDLIGSIRLPASFCGVYGHKPTPNLIPIDGNLPICTNDRWNSYCTNGPMTRYAKDLSLLFDVMVAPELRHIIPIPITPIKNLRMFYIENDGACSITNRVDDDISTAIRKIVNYFKIYGCSVKKANIERMNDIVDIALLTLLNVKGLQTVFDQDKSLLNEILKTSVCSATVEPATILCKMVYDASHILTSGRRLENLDDELRILRKELDDLLGEDGVLFYPAFPSVAFYHGEFFSKAVDSSYMGIFNVLGFPSTVCPIGFNKENLPIGMQIVASPNMDKLCFKVAEEIENQFGGWLSPKFENIRAPL